MISKMVRSMNVANYEGAYYKVPSMMKKNIWAYTAAFIDSDGYITLDRNMNPRVGLVATGERGKAFMQEMHKSIGFGRMHLDQKSPQDTRLINRLNFYSQDDVTDLLTKCLPHFRLKKGNAKLLLELIRMKKSYKKADWYKDRCDEIFKLMKWENHKDHVGFDWAKENIYLDDIAKLQGNCKMSLMDELENVGGIVLKNDPTRDDEEIPQQEIKDYLYRVKDAMRNKTMRREDEDTILEWIEFLERTMKVYEEGEVPFFSYSYLINNLEKELKKYNIDRFSLFSRKEAMET